MLVQNKVDFYQDPQQSQNMTEPKEDNSSIRMLTYFKNIRNRPETVSNTDFTPAPIYCDGDKLKRGLIDISKTNQFIHEFQTGTWMNQDLKTQNAGNSEALEVKAPKLKWSEVLMFMEANPKALMDAIPSPGPLERKMIEVSK